MLHQRRLTEVTWSEISSAALRAARRSGRPVTEVVTITPSLAAEILKNNIDNRNVTKAKVDTYAADMLSGRWQGLNGQTIVVANDANVNDGQHRLLAVIKSGVSVDTLVTFGVARETRMTLDQNKPRTPGDYLGMSGIASGTKIAAIAHTIYCYQNNLLPSASGATEYLGGGKISKAALTEFARDNIVGIKEAIDAAGGRTARIVATETRMASAFYIIKQATTSPEDVVYFFDRLLNGDQITASSPILVCRNKLLAEKQAKRRIPVARFLEIVVRSWNAFRAGQNLGKIQCSGNIPEIAS